MWCWLGAEVLEHGGEKPELVPAHAGGQSKSEAQSIRVAALLKADRDRDPLPPPPSESPPSTLPSHCPLPRRANIMVDCE